MAPQIAPFVTLWHEQMVAPSGRSPGVSPTGSPSPAGRMSRSGRAGAGMSPRAYCSTEA